MDQDNTEQRTIVVRVQNSYGKRLVYPDCSQSQAFCDIARQNTLTEHSIKCIKTLGYRIKVRASEVDL